MKIRKYSIYFSKQDMIMELENNINKLKKIVNFIVFGKNHENQDFFHDKTSWNFWK